MSPNPRTVSRPSGRSADGRAEDIHQSYVRQQRIRFDRRQEALFPGPMLLEILEGNEIAPVSITMPHTLMVRSSTAPPRRR